MKTRTGKRILTLLLALVMLMSLFPASVFADEGEAEPDQPVISDVVLDEPGEDSGEDLPPEESGEPAAPTGEDDPTAPAGDVAEDLPAPGSTATAGSIIRMTTAGSTTSQTKRLRLRSHSGIPS